MRQNNQTTIRLIGLAILIVLVCLPLTACASPATPKPLTGSWDVVINVIQQNATFPGFMTFYSDGNLIADEVPSPLETSGHGAWIQNSGDKAIYSFSAVVGSTEPGKWTKLILNGTANYVAASDTWNGPFTIKVIDQDGTEIFSDTGTMKGTRIKAGP